MEVRRSRLDLSAGFTFIEMLVTLAIIGLTTSLLIAGFGASKRRARDIHCKGNLRQVGIALRLYADDNRGLLPVTTVNDQAQFASLNAYISGTLKCKEDRTDRSTKVGWSYSLNHVVSRLSLHTLSMTLSPEPSIAFDYDNWHGYKNAVFSDGSVRRQN